MRTYICYKRDWEEEHIFDVMVDEQEEVILKSIHDEYEKDKSRFSYYVEVWENRKRIHWLILDKKTMELESYIIA